MADAREKHVWDIHAAQQMVQGAYAPDAEGKDYLARWLRAEPWENVLDFGSGTGLWALQFNDGHYTGLDQNDTMIAGARERHKETIPRKEFVLCPGVADGAKMPFADGTFSVVFTAAVIQHNRLADQRVVLRELRRVLRVGGRYIMYENTLGDFNPGSDDGYSHTQEGWRNLLAECGFACVEQVRDRHLFRAV